MSRGLRDGVWKLGFNPLLYRAYAGASPGQTDTLPALVEIAPR